MCYASLKFAHTEDALQKAITTLKPFVKGKLILVFGVYADMSESGREKRYGMEDREKAIQHAIDISTKDDCILLAGKGHETTQVIGNKEIYFSEKEIVQDAMKNKVWNES